MELTFIGAAQLAVGTALLLFGSTTAMFVFAIACGLMGGSAALLLPALGGSSIPPVQFALPFLVARLALTGGGPGAFAEATRANKFHAVFVAYGALAAVAGPRLFLGAMEVPPLRFRGTRHVFDTVPLAPTSQNLTTAVYLAGGLALAVCAHMACRHERAPRVLAGAGVGVAAIHAATGIAGALFAGTAVRDALDLFRNGAYAQLDDGWRGFVRINGVFPEASAYAAYALAWFVFLAECRWRGVRPRATGPAALLLAGVLVFSTSSSAYIGLTAYAALFLLRMLAAPRTVPAGRALAVAGLALAGLILALGTAALSPGFAAEFGDMLSRMTVEKGGSYSGIQRSFWAWKGLEAFTVSHGLGVGPGSFRSSSLLTAILGSVGVVGAFAFAAHAVRVLQPWRLSTYAPSGDERLAVGAAAAWAAVAILIPAAFVAPSADPGSEFALFAGAALGLRARHVPAARVRPIGGAEFAPA